MPNFISLLTNKSVFAASSEPQISVSSPGPAHVRQQEETQVIHLSTGVAIN